MLVPVQEALAAPVDWRRRPWDAEHETGAIGTSCHHCSAEVDLKQKIKSAYIYYLTIVLLNCLFLFFIILSWNCSHNFQLKKTKNIYVYFTAGNKKKHQYKNVRQFISA